MKALNLAAALAASLLIVSPAAVAKAKSAGLTRHFQSLAAKAPKAKQAKIKRAECIDLNGTWKGSCTSSDNDQWDDDIVVDQDDCNYFDLDGLYLDVGGAETIGSTSPTFTYGGTIFTDWNASGTVLRLKFALAGRQLGDDSFFMNVRGDQDYQIVNGQLIYRILQDSTVDSGGQHTQEKYWETCTYDKVAVTP